MPQLDASGFSSQLFWLTISFIILYIILAKTLLPRIAVILETRAETVKSSIEKAEMLKSEAERVRDEYERTVLDIKARAKQLIVETQLRNAETLIQQEAALAAKIEKKLQDSEANIGKAKQNAMANIVPVVSDVASLITKSLAYYTPEASELQTAINHNLAK